MTTVSCLQLSSKHRLRGKLLSWAFGFAPVVMFLLTLDVYTSPTARLIKTYAWPVVAVEVAVIVIALTGISRAGLALGITGMVHPHNIVLQVLLAWGVVGAALLALLGFILGRVVVRQGQSDPRSLPVLTAATVLAAYSMIDGTLYGVHPTSVFAMGIGLTAGRRA